MSGTDRDARLAELEIGDVGRDGDDAAVPRPPFADPQPASVGEPADHRTAGVAARLDLRHDPGIVIVAVDQKLARADQGAQHLLVAHARTDEVGDRREGLHVA